MKKTLIALATAAALSIALVGCGGNEMTHKEKLQQKSISVYNSTWYAKQWLKSQEAKSVGAVTIVSEGDSSIAGSCDGFTDYDATVNAYDASQNKVMKLSCPTMDLGEDGVCMELSLAQSKDDYTGKGALCAKELLTKIGS